MVLRPSPRFNVIAGPNGQGKTNLLEAIDYLAVLRSFRGAKARELLAWNGAGAARIDVQAQALGGVASSLRVDIAAGRRSVEVDGKRPRTLGDYLASVPTVLFFPAEIEAVRAEPALRRRWVDRLAAQTVRTFVSEWQGYQRALRSRNRLLRQPPPDRAQIEALDEILAKLGARIVRTRAQIVAETGPLAARAYAAVAQGRQALAIGYAASVAAAADATGLAQTEEALRAALEAGRAIDAQRRSTRLGPHADDLHLRLDGRLARHAASQGEQRAIVLAWKIASAEWLAGRTGVWPILLLDDVSSELDAARSQALFDFLRGQGDGSQVFLTTTEPRLIPLAGDRMDFVVEAGRVQERGSA